MEGSKQSNHGLTWEGFGWSEWYTLKDALAVRASPVPVQAGLYRIRVLGEPGLIYIGQTGRSLRSRFGQLRTSMQRAAGGLDARAPHVVGTCAYEHERRGGIIEVSWVATPDLDKRERLGREVDLIAGYRREVGGNPSCQFAGVPGD